MSKIERTGYDYIPSAGEPYYPQGRKRDDQLEGSTLHQGTDSSLVKTKEGDIVVTDRNGARRG